MYKMLENYYLIDWLSFTAKLGDPLEVIQKGACLTLISIW